MGGGLLVYWKSTGHNTLSEPSQLWAANLSVDGTALASRPVNLLNQTAAWEARDGVGCIEAPAMLEDGAGILDLGLNQPPQRHPQRHPQRFLCGVTRKHVPGVRPSRQDASGRRFWNIHIG